ncbi:aldo/keto reductase [Microbacterium ulmi]|uniref:Aldo/keto reductase n=1 Tax=Microbacterium ulmi TaxID=179095 RepID=A0A7Y2M379_9MICO|nr:aldo/keto reductase [Microbacterium ulmi]NII70531.1 aryl-alcohol dehydrogenase-like predicted oxidoreductase [Microbacterium ulmi]NNH05209.1 aldo/keto reductase [Microbacterium ulmi]
MLESSPDRVPLGRSDLRVSSVGYGSMPLGGIYGAVDDRAAVDLLRHVIDSGVDFIDTSSVYAEGRVEVLVGEAIQGRRDDVVVATKFGMTGPGLGHPDRVRPALVESLRRLGTDYVDLYYLHQIDPTTPIEDTVWAMGELVEEGLVRAIGLSEVTPSTIRRAHEAFPIAAVQEEYSLLAREIEETVLPTLRELGISLVAYSPFGRGLLTGRIRRPDDVAPDDVRRERYPRFDGRALRANLAAAAPLFALAEELGTTPTELALGWVLASHNTIPIPGTRSPANFDANVEAARFPQDAAITRRLSRMFPVGVARGERYPPNLMQRIREAP